MKGIPWYLVLGSPEAGKFSLIQNVGLDFKSPDYLGREAIHYLKSFPNFKWYFSNEAILIDILQNESSTKLEDWERFSKLFRSELKNHSINGVIVVFSLTDLMLYSNQKHQDFLKNIVRYLHDIFSKLSTPIPIYVLFNKVDLVKGFSAFFEMLTQEESNQVFGFSVSFLELNKLDALIGAFNSQYANLIENLSNRVLWTMNSEPNLTKRELIHHFPQEMQTFRKPIENFIIELFRDVQSYKAIQLKGIYFLSCLQNPGNQEDFFQQGISKKFQLISTSQRVEIASRGGFFLRRLFLDVIFSGSVEFDLKHRRRIFVKKILNFVLLISPIIFIILMIGTYLGYQENLKNREKISQAIKTYTTQLVQLSSHDFSLAPVVPILEPLEAAKNLYVKPDSWGGPLLLASYLMKNAIFDAEKRAIEVFLWPRLVRYLEFTLRQNGLDQDLLYAYFKGYLVFDQTGLTRQEALRFPLQYSWVQSYSNEIELMNRLNLYLDLGLRNSKIQFPLDRALINKIASELKQVSPSERAYALLVIRAKLGVKDDLLLPLLSGPGLSDLFVQSDQRIPFLFTHKFFNEVFVKQYKGIADEVLEDNENINAALKNQEALQEIYSQHYIDFWFMTLSNIHVKRFATFAEAVLTIDLIVNEDSVLQKLLTIIHDNTVKVNVKSDKVGVSQAFSKLNEYVKNNSPDSSLAEIFKVLLKLKEYLLVLQQAPDQSLSSFNAAIEILNKQKSNPFTEFNTLIEKAPAPLKQWMQELSQSCWRLILKGAHQQINFVWQTKVMTLYKNNLRGRYPLNLNSELNVNKDEFNVFWGTGGVLEDYFNQYMRPFLVKDNSDLQLLNVNGLTIAFPQATLVFLKKIAFLRNSLFPNSSSTMQLNFMIQPLTLDSRASSMSFKIGDQKIEYSHGLQISSPIFWPLLLEDESVQITIKTFERKEFTDQRSSFWGFLKVLQKGVLQPSSVKDAYLFKINLKGYTASYEFKGANVQGIVSLMNLKDYAFPERIIGVEQ